MTNTPAGQDPSNPIEKGDSAAVALANAAGRGTPSVEAGEIANRWFPRDTLRQPLAAEFDAFAARRVEQAVAQERDRCLYWFENEAGDVAVEAIESGRPKP